MIIIKIIYQSKHSTLKALVEQWVHPLRMYTLKLRKAHCHFSVIIL